MRFLFEYVTCCLMIPPCNKEESSSHGTSSLSRAEDETRSLVKESALRPRRRKKMSTRGTSADWQPSLFAISEDNAVSATPQKAQPVKQPPSPRNVKRCVASSGRVNGNSRSYDFSRDPIPMVVPAFSAAPFMF